jgi:hypothetical protein
MPDLKGIIDIEPGNKISNYTSSHLYHLPNLSSQRKEELKSTALPLSVSVPT